MPWSDEFVLGIESIDTQHRWLVEATNRLYDQIESQQPDTKVVGEILEGLVDYTMNHFILEEDLFNRLGYPESEAHKREHDSFTNQAMKLLLDFDGGEPVTEDTMEFLKAWLIHHILRVDKAYVPFLKANGVV
ncbi:bacteriohemerythrin [Azovibrio restrictus]|uniref:bacteriohemerythrin n=1 Tax=Azovibrio restrictus TaxID=146938 RepID=UPI0026EFCF8F|nr:bacteriohemerythrin [Azovibrio restrictus]MDD3482591.1 bacteriohemerythrin [Azovibrio restrictus]